MNGLRAVFSLCFLFSSLIVCSRGTERAERLINLSSRATVGTGAQAMVAGFIVGEGAPKQILIRAVGPSLAQFPGLADSALKKTYLEVFDHRGSKLFENTSWRRGTFGTLATAADFVSVGAFSLVSDEDAALLVTLAPGAYTAQVSAENRGVGLIEVYDVSGNSRLLNLSTRAQIQSPSDVVISGLVVAPSAASKRLLIRAMGPSLTRFEVPGVLSDPRLEIRNSSGVVMVANDNWFNDQQGTAVASASAAIGAFAFSEPTSKDAAVIATLAQGSYTILVSGTNGSTGIALVEVYDLSMIGPPTINVSATARVDSATSRSLGVFTISRTGSTSAPLTVHFTLEGTANAGFDYAGVPYYAVIPSGFSSVSVEIMPVGNHTTPGFVSDRTVQLKINPSADYQIGTASFAHFVIPGIRPSPTPSLTPSPTPTLRPSPTPTPTPSATPTPSPTPRPSPTASPTPSPAPSLPPVVITPTPSPGPTRQPTPTPTPSPIPTRPPTPSPLPTLVPTPTAIPTPTPTPLPEPEPEPVTPTPQPTSPPTPTASPTPTPAALTSIEVHAEAATVTAGGRPGRFLFTRTGSTLSALSIDFSLQGTARSGTDYPATPTTVSFAPGNATASLEITPYGVVESTPMQKTVTLTLISQGDYLLGSASSATVTYTLSPGPLYASSLRVPETSTGSSASGTASLRLSSDSSFAHVSVNFHGLSSAQTVAYLRLGDKDQVGTELVRLPSGQVSNQRWTLRATGNLTIADVLTALQNGRVFVSIQTVNLPGGELVGSFTHATGSTVFVPPDAPPALPSTTLSAVDAARFLTQATFGPKKAEIDALTQSPASALNTWITTQVNLPASSLRTETQADFAAFSQPGGSTSVSNTNRQAAWWKVAVKGQDQLRQRVAFALSQIFVVSETNGVLSGNPSALSGYYDLLVQHAFGNYRTLLEEVSMSPVMGVYLSHLRNGKATFNAQGVQLTYPDENYAREIMQLFSVGLNQLHPDGSLVLDVNGAPVPVYTQQTIAETAKVFTGWGFASSATNPSFYGAASNYNQRMRLYPNFHDTTAKTIVGGRVLPANQGGEADLRDTLDTLFHHSNTAPFISRLLIQRLVTSNPSPGYIYRVAQVFENNGSGVRGDLGAVIRAILTDYEARSATAASGATYGKLREPILRATALLRGLGGDSNSGRIAITSGTTENNLGQTPLRSPTVFNFFSPNYVHPGALARSGLFAPEFQVLTDYTAVATPNFLRGYIQARRAVTTDTASQTVALAPDPATLASTQTPQVLVDQLNLILAGGRLNRSTVNRIVAAITAMPAATTDANREERYRSAVYLVLTTPQGVVQK